MQMRIRQDPCKIFKRKEKGFIANYSHYNQSLAHPPGANFRECILQLRFQPMHVLTVSVHTVFTYFGDDTETKNWSGNILIPNTSRVRDYNNEVAQGDLREIRLFRLDARYEIFHNYFVDFQLLWRNQNQTETSLRRNTKYFGIGLGTNMPNQRLDY